MSRLQTARLTLRPLAQSDVSMLHQFWTDPEVRRYLWGDQIMSESTISEIVDASEQFFQTTGSGFFALEHKEQAGELVGFCGHRQFEDGERVELLYAITPEYWGEGLVTEAAREVLRHGFSSCGFETVIAATDTPNQPAVRVMQRLGMIFDRRTQFHDLDTVFYTLSKADFEPR